MCQHQWLLLSCLFQIKFHIYLPIWHVSRYEKRNISTFRHIIFLNWNSVANIYLKIVFFFSGSAIQSNFIWMMPKNVCIWMNWCVQIKHIIKVDFVLIAATLWQFDYKHWPYLIYVTNIYVRSNKLTIELTICVKSWVNDTFWATVGWIAFELCRQ